MHNLEEGRMTLQLWTEWTDWALPIQLSYEVVNKALIIHVLSLYIVLIGSKNV